VVCMVVVTTVNNVRKNNHMATQKMIVCTKCRRAIMEQNFSRHQEICLTGGSKTNTINQQLCLLCKQSFPLETFKEHFIKCRENHKAEQAQKIVQPKDNATKTPQKGGCNCGRNKRT
jgi:hypothetical protein